MLSNITDKYYKQYSSSILCEMASAKFLLYFLSYIYRITRYSRKAGSWRENNIKYVDQDTP